MRSTSYDPQNDLPSPLSLGAYASLASAFTAQSQDDLLTPTDVVVASSASAPTDLFFAYHDMPLEWAGPSRHLPADPCTASPPPLYSEGLKWGSELSLRAKERGLPDPGDVPPTFEQPHSGTALGLYIPQTDEPVETTRLCARLSVGSSQTSVASTTAWPRRTVPWRYHE
jgi:hypothetical protein